MIEPIKSAEIRKLMTNEDLTPQDRIRELMKLRDDARAEQRMASESPANDDDGLNDRLRELELALEHLGESPSEQEGMGPASL